MSLLNCSETDLLIWDAARYSYENYRYDLDGKLYSPEDSPEARRSLASQLSLSDDDIRGVEELVRSERERAARVRYSISHQPHYSREPVTHFSSSLFQDVLNDAVSSAEFAKVMEKLQAMKDMSFVDKMLSIIDSKQKRDSEVYKAAQVDRRLFSKIVSDRTYKPAKDTCVALCLALELTLAEANDLLSRAGYTLSHSNVRDIIIEYFFVEHIYSVVKANEVLSGLNLHIIGRE